MSFFNLKCQNRIGGDGFEIMLDVTGGKPTAGPDPKHQLTAEVVSVIGAEPDATTENPPVRAGERYDFLSDGPWDLPGDLEGVLELGPDWGVLCLGGRRVD